MPVTESNPFAEAARLRKRDRILLSLRVPFREAVSACIAAHLREPTYADLARTVEQRVRLYADGAKFPLVFGGVATERASHKTWSLVIAALRGMERPS